MARLTEYSDEQIAYAVALAESSTIKGAAAKLKIPRTTLRGWVNGQKDKRSTPKKPDDNLVALASQRIRDNWRQIAEEATSAQLALLASAKSADGGWDVTKLNMLLRGNLALKTLAVQAGIATDKQESPISGRSVGTAIQIVFGDGSSSLRELAQRSMSVRLPPSGRTDIAPLAIDAVTYDPSDQGEEENSPA